MGTNSENSLIRTEGENLKFGGLTAALGLVAVAGSLAIPNHNRQLENLQVSLETAGVAVVLKGTMQALEAMDQLDELDRANSGEEN